MNPAPSLSDRIAGGLHGALVGDALGVPVEFSARFARDADPVTGMRGWGTYHQPPGTWSDDGALLLCTAEGLLGRYSPDHIGALFIRWMNKGYLSARGDVFDIGIATATALGRIGAGTPALAAGMTGEDQNGNGSLMRTLPVALRFGAARDEAVMIACAREISSITHAHVRSQLACVLYCLLAARLLAGLPAAQAHARAVERFQPLLAEHPGEQAVFARLVSGQLGECAREEIDSSGYVIHTLEAALWCLLRHDTFAATVLAAVNLGGDTDTTGCVAGGLAGVLYGLPAIPEAWVDALPASREMFEVVNAFVPIAVNSYHEPSR